MDNVSFTGSHGTSVTNAETISKNGFVTRSGIRGRGAYFWDKIDSSTHHILSKGWHAQCYERNKYSGQKNQACAIIEATITCKKNEYLDLESRTVITPIREIVSRLTNMSTEVSKISEAYDKAIQAIETENNTKAKVLTARVTGPKEEYCKNYNYVAYGNPYCVIARERDIINNIRRLSDTELEQVK